MRLSEIKGEQAFKTMGGVIGCLRDLFGDEKMANIVTEQEKGWILAFFSASLEEKPDVWMRMYLLLNPDATVDDVNIGSIVKFAYEFKNDEELMSLFFSQGEQMVNKSSGSPMESIKETETM